MPAASPVHGKKRKYSTVVESGVGFKTPFKVPLIPPRQKDRIGMISASLRWYSSLYIERRQNSSYRCDQGRIEEEPFRRTRGESSLGELGGSTLPEKRYQDCIDRPRSWSVLGCEEEESS